MFKTKKDLFVWSLIIIISLVMTACGSAGNQESAEEQETPKGYTVEHAMGTTTIPDNPKRIVILTNHGTEALLALGIKPVGAVESFNGDPWYSHIADEMEGVEVVGSGEDGKLINKEKIAALKPDLIIGNKMRQEEIYEQLNDIAPTVFEETLRGDWKINFELIAKAVNKEEKGKEVLASFDNRVAELREKLGDNINTEVSMVRFMPNDVRIYHKDSFSGAILEQIGLKRPESQDVADFAAKGVTKERYPEMDGDVIFYFTYEEKGKEGAGQQVEDLWINDQRWENLEAVKAGNVYEVSDTIWNTAGGVIAANAMLDDLEDKLLGE